MPPSTLDYSQTPARLEIHRVSAGYNGALALQEVSFQVPHGGQVAVVGPNGAGKSTLFKVLVGLLPLRAGAIHIHGQPLGHHLDCVAYIPQREEVDWRFPATVLDVVLMGRYGHTGWFRRVGKADVDAARAALAQMGLADLANRSINNLSGGQQQRVFLARALAQEPHILLMDEPFTGVDAPSQEAVLGLLEELRQRQVTVLISTHDLTLAAQRFEQVLLLNRKVIAYGNAETVFSPENLRRAFGGQVLMMNGALVVDQCCPPEDEP